MERTNKVTELHIEGNTELEVGMEGRAVRARDVRALADLELMLVGGGQDTPDWGG